MPLRRALMNETGGGRREGEKKAVGRFEGLWLQPRNARRGQGVNHEWETER
jgi:hypothetical protein